MVVKFLIVNGKHARLSVLYPIVCQVIHATLWYGSGSRWTGFGYVHL